MKLKLPKQLIAALLAYPCSYADETWQSLPATYDTNGGVVGIIVDGDQFNWISNGSAIPMINITGAGGTLAMNGDWGGGEYGAIHFGRQGYDDKLYASCIHSEASLELSNLSHLIFDGVMLSLPDSSASSDVALKGAGVSVDGNLTMSNIGQIMLTGNRIDRISTVSFPASVNLAGGALYASGDIVLDAVGRLFVDRNRVNCVNTTERGGVVVARGGAIAAGGNLELINFKEGISFSSNIVRATIISDGDLMAVSTGGAIDSGGAVVFEGGVGNVLFENNTAYALVLSDTGDSLSYAAGGAVAAKQGIIINGPIQGDLTFRKNSALANACYSASAGPEDMAIAGASGGALNLGGHSRIANVKGTLLFDSNYAIGFDEEPGIITVPDGENPSFRASPLQDLGGRESITAVGGAIALREGATLVLDANLGDIIFRDNAVGRLDQSPDEVDLQSYHYAGGAIYVEGGPDRHAADTLVLAASEGRIIAFTGNRTGALFEELIRQEDIPVFDMEAGEYTRNAIHIKRNAQLHVTGDGSAFFNGDTITSGDEGGVSLRKTGGGTLYLRSGDSVINGAGRGDQALSVEGGAIHAGDGASLRLQGAAARFVIDHGGVVSGNGTYHSEGGFIIRGSLAPDNYLYILDQPPVNPEHYAIARSGSPFGRMTLDGNARFEGGRLAHKIDMRQGVSDVTVITGGTSGVGYWMPVATHEGDLKLEDVSKNIVVLEVHGEQTPGANISGTLDAGNYKIHLENGPNPNGDGVAWWTAYKGEQSSQVDVVLNTAAAMSGIWYRQLDSLVKRMGELRMTPERYARGNVWMRTYGHQNDIDLKINGVNDFREFGYGVDVGIDRLYDIDDDNRLALGVFTGYQRMDRQFHDEYRSRGNTDSMAGGIYLTWLEKKEGWYADFVLKGQSFDNTGKIHGTQPSKFQYDTWGLGASLEAGRQIELKNRWFLEPMIQVAWLHLGGRDYSLANGSGVKTKSGDTWQFSGMMRGGRTNPVGCKGNHVIQTYAKLGVIQQVSGHGRVHMSDQSWRPNTDGTVGVAGVGAIWQYRRHQVHFDFEAGLGSKVDTPWSVNLGYRIAF